jgi:hypothetical protein
MVELQERISRLSIINFFIHHDNIHKQMNQFYRQYFYGQYHASRQRRRVRRIPADQARRGRPGHTAGGEPHCPRRRAGKDSWRFIPASARKMFSDFFIDVEIFNYGNARPARAFCSGYAGRSTPASNSIMSPPGSPRCLASAPRDRGADHLFEGCAFSIRQTGRKHFPEPADTERKQRDP